MSPSGQKTRTNRGVSEQSRLLAVGKVLGQAIEELITNASPNLNGRGERVILTTKSECLSKFILFGKRHLDHVLAEFTEYYNTVRSSMVRDHLPPVRDGEPEEIETINLSQVRVNSHVGRLVKSFARKAA